MFEKSLARRRDAATGRTKTKTTTKINTLTLWPQGLGRALTRSINCFAFRMAAPYDAGKCAVVIYDRLVQATETERERESALHG